MEKLRTLLFKTPLVSFLILAPALLLTLLIYRYAVNVPVTDQYALVPLFQRIDHGTLTFGNLWAQHNEHRIFFPQTFQLILASITHWSIKAEIITSALVAFTGFAAMLQLIKRTKYAPLFGAVTAITASLLFFSPIQSENWIWGWQLEWFMCVSGVLWALFFLSKVPAATRSNKNLWLAILFATIATFSLGSGPVVWVSGLVLLLLSETRRKVIGIWSGAGALAIFAYYFHYQSPPAHPSLTAFIRLPLVFVQYYLTYLGGGISDKPDAAVLVGASVLALFAICAVIILRNKALIRKYAPWLSLGVFVLIVALETSVGRMAFGVIGAVSSRYSTISILLDISVFAMVVGLLAERELILSKSVKPWSIVVVIAVLMAAPLWSSYFLGLQGMRQRSHLYRYIKACSQAQVPTQGCLYQIYFPSTAQALDMLNYLKQKHYGGY